uniref:Sodium/proline symporter n=1 Tax=candidate division WOR-3 bacterium TaxID=2052148 RepID=A0A7C4CEM9_UNCW3
MGVTLIYVLVLGGYLLAQFLIGLAARRRAASAEGFYLGTRSIGAWVTAFSFVAAYFSSVVIIGGGGFGYKFGMATLWVGAGNTLVGMLLAWIVLGARTRAMTGRLNTITMPGFFARRFDSPAARLISALVVTVFLALYSVSVVQGMGHVFEVLIGVPYALGVLISALVIIAYVAIGGYTAVVWTGFVQGIIMILGVVLLTLAALNRAGGLAQVFSRLGEIEGGKFLATPGVWGWSGLISFTMIVSFGVWGMPQLVTRFYSIRNVNVLRLGTVLATAGGCMALLPYFNGALARVLFPNLARPDLAIPMLVKETMSPFTSALFLAGVIAAGMSTFASVLIVAVSSLVKDLGRDSFGAKLSPEREALVSRLVSIGIGLAAVLVALKPPAMILVITGFAWAVIASTTLWPYLFGLYWRRATAAGVVAAMVGGSAVALVWLALKNPLGLHGFVPGMIVSLLLLVGVSLVTPAPVAAARAAFGDREPSRESS